MAKCSSSCLVAEPVPAWVVGVVKVGELGNDKGAVPPEAQLGARCRGGGAQQGQQQQKE
jgi:hypothetical protein